MLDRRYSRTVGCSCIINNLGFVCRRGPAVAHALACSGELQFAAQASEAPQMPPVQTRCGSGGPRGGPQPGEPVAAAAPAKIAKIWQTSLWLPVTVSSFSWRALPWVTSHLLPAAAVCDMALEATK